MSKVLVTREKLDKLASIIGGKADVAVPLTIDGTIAAAETLGKGGAEPNLQTKSVSITPSTSAQTQTVNPDTGYDGMDQVNVNVSAVPIADATGVINSDSFQTNFGNRIWRISVKGYAESGGYVEEGPFGSPNDYNYSAVAANTSITPTESPQTVGGSKYMMEGAVTVNAIPSNYVGSGITQRTSSDVTSSGDTVTIPGGFYGSSVTKIISAVTQDNDGYLVLDDEGGGGGLVYETGTFTPSEDVARPTISFQNSHAKRPMCIMLFDVGETDPGANSNLWFMLDNWYDVFGAVSSSQNTYARTTYSYKTSTGTIVSTTNIVSLISTDSIGYSYWVSESSFTPCSNSDARYWRNGRTYKWVAVWGPTS